MGDAVQPVAPLAPGVPETLVSFLDQVMDSEPDGAGPAAEHFAAALRQLQPFEHDPDYSRAQSLLEAFMLQNQGLYLIQTSADFSSGADLLAQACTRFAAAALPNLAEFCQGLQMTMQANVELRQQNLGAGQKLLNDAQKLLAKDITLRLKYAPLIDDIVCGSLGLGAIQAVQMMNFPEARALSEEAAAKTEAYALKYLEEGTPLRSFYLGLAKFRRTFYQFSKVQADFAIFSFAEVLSADDAVRTARDARALLEQAAKIPMATEAYCQSKAFAEMLEVFPDITALADALLKGLPAPKMEYTTLRAHLKLAADAAADAGKGSLPILRVCERLGETLENLRRFDEARTPPIARPTDPKSPLQLFVIMPFAEQSKVVEQALRRVLEDDPYWFRIVLARDSTLAPNLLDNVKAHMHLSDAFLADISGLNPNVMMELGMVESDPAERPVFVLKRKSDKDTNDADIPSDLKGRLYVEYDLLATANSEDQIRTLAADLKTKLGSLEELTGLGKRPHVRYTSMQYVQRRLTPKKMQLSKEEFGLLQKGFPSLEELEMATPDAIAMKTGFDRDVAGVIANVFAAPPIGKGAVV